MHITRINNIINKNGYTNTIEKNYKIQKINNHYQYINHPITVKEPIVENIDELIIVHNNYEQYI